MDQITFNKPRESGEILTDTFRYIRLNYKTLGKPLLFFVVPFYVIQAFLLKEVGEELFSVLLNMEDSPDALSGIFTWKYFLGIIFSLIAISTLAAVTIKHIRLYTEGMEPTIENITDNLVNQVASIMALFIIIGIAAFFSAFLFLLPAVFLSVMWVLSPISLLVEDDNPLTAMKRSWNLISGYWWRTFWFVLGVYIIIVFSSYIFIMPVAIFSAFAAAFGAAGDSVASISMILYSIASAFASLFYVIMYVALALYFFNLKERKEGGGLRSKIEQLSN